MCRIVPCPTLRIGRRCECEATRPQDAVRLSYDERRIMEMLEDVFHQDSVKARVRERQWLAQIAYDDLLAIGLRLRVETGVVRKEVSGPARPATDIKERCVLVEAANDIHVVARS